jgi:glycosyltransferase involved in cell wall biosynthesis
MNLSPQVTVIMPAYNAEKYIGEAIKSILNQTFQDFEFIIFNDGSTDNTEDIIFSYTDLRVIYVKNEENLKLPKTLNKGIALARGQYIARMDSDDVALVHRLETQITFMENNPHISLCGTWVETFGQREEILGHPLMPKHIKAQMLLECCIFHPTILFRKKDFVDNNFWYDTNYLYAEDYELWSRAVHKLQFANLDTVLLKYRLHQQQSVSIVKNNTISTLQRQIRANQLKNLGIAFSPEEMSLHERLATRDYEMNLSFWEMTTNWLSKLYLANKISKVHDDNAFKEVLFKRIWYPIFQLLVSKYRFNLKFWKQILHATLFLKPLIKVFGKRFKIRWC